MARYPIIKFLSISNSHDRLIFLLSIVVAVLFGVSYCLSPYLLVILTSTITLVVLLLAGPEVCLHVVILTFFIEFTSINIIISETKDAANYPLCFFFMLLTLLSIFIEKAIKNKARWQTAPLDYIILIIVFYMSISILWGPSTKLGILFYFQLLFGVLLYFLLTAVVVNEAVLMRLSISLLISGLLFSVSVFVSQNYEFYREYRMTELISKEVILSLYRMRKVLNRTSGLGMPITASFLVLTSIINIAMFFYTSRKLLKLINILILSASVYAIIVLGTRGAFVSLIASTVMFFFVHPIYKIRFIKYCLCFFALYGIIVIFIAPGFLDRILIGFGYRGDTLFTNISTMSQKGSDLKVGSKSALSSQKEGISGTSARLRMWKEGLTYMKKHPLTFIFGLGIAGFVYVSTNTVNEVHGLIVSFFFEMGVIGVFFEIVLFYILFITMSQVKKYLDNSFISNMTLASAVTLLSIISLYGLIDFDLTSHISRYIWFFLGFYMACFNLLKKKVERDSGTPK
ncbi:MAG: O-antigen ligase family protein [Nitrospirae bacterium YQR-1]